MVLTKCGLAVIWSAELERSLDEKDTVPVSVEPHSEICAILDKLDVTMNKPSSLTGSSMIYSLISREVHSSYSIIHWSHLASI